MHRKAPVPVLAVGAIVMAAVVALAAPSSSQTPDVTVAEVSGGAFGVFAEIRSDVLGQVFASDIEDLVRAAAEGDEQAAAAMVEDVDLSGERAGIEAVLAGVGPVPEVVLPPEGGGPFDDSLANIDLDGDIIAELASVVTEGATGPDGFAASEATVAGLDLLGLIEGEAVTTACLADLDDTSGSTSLVNVEGIISGPFPEDPAPNTESPFTLDVTFPIDPDGTTLTIQYATILNEQFVEGNELTVNGLHTLLSVRIDPEGPDAGLPELVIFELEAIVAQSRCGVVPADVVPPDAEPIAARPTFAG